MNKYANRGRPFEELVSYAVQQLNTRGVARIDQTPPPVKILRRDKRGQVHGYIMAKGLPDFVGYTHGKGIAFDAKSTKERTRFPLANIHEHQIDYLQDIDDLGHRGFFLVHFEKLEETYLLTIKQAQDWTSRAKQGGRQSIPHDYFRLYTEPVKSQRGLALDIIGALEKGGETK